METVGGLLGLAAMIGFVLAFVCLIRPIKAVKMGTGLLYTTDAADEGCAV